MKYTYNGDSNLDGKIDADDYFRIDSGFLSQRANPKYRDGDFNYDARVNADDYFLIDESFLRQGAVMSAASVTAAASTTTANSAAAAPAVPVSATTAAAEQQRRKPIKRATASVFSTASVRQGAGRSPRTSR